MTATGDHPRSGPLGSRFWAVWTAFTATNLADGLSIVAFPLLALSATDDARLVAVVSVFRFLPFLVVGLPAGVLLDRVDRRWAAVLAQVGRAVVMAATAALVLDGRGGIAVLSVAAFVMGVGEIITDGGLPALVRDLVADDRLEVANSRFSATQTVSNMFIGPPLGALLFEWEPAAPLALAVALMVVAVLVLSRVPGRFKPEPKASSTDGTDGGDEPEGLWAQIMVGLRYVWGHAVIRPLALAVMTFAFAGAATNAVFVILATERFGLSSFAYGAVIGVDGAAAVAMSFLVAGLVRRTSAGFSMQVSILAFTVGSLLWGLTTSIVGIVLGGIIIGVADPTWNVNSATVRQRVVPDHVFGRVMTAYRFISWSMIPVGALLGGVIAEQWGAQWVSILSAGVVGSLLVWGRPLFRAVDEATSESSATSQPS